MVFAYKLKRKKVSAFSLIELLISVSIIALMASLSISAYPKFSAQLQATTESYKLLAWLRETQTYGVSSFTLPGEKQVYGIKFDKNDNSIKRVIAPLNSLVSDKFGPSSKFTNTAFANSQQDFIGEDPVFAFSSQFKIVGLCDVETCDPLTSSYDTAYAVYRRPNPEARIFFEQGTLKTPSISQDGDRGSMSRLVIFLSSATQKEIRKKVIILRTGQMYVQEW